MFSNINRYAFSRSTISGYLTKAGFQQNLIDNDKPKCLHGRRQELKMGTVIAMAGWVLVNIVRLITGSRILIASCLFVRASKPGSQKLA
jgi:hypothetical protein